MATLLAIIIVLPIGFLGAYFMFLTITEQDDDHRKHDNLKNARLAYEATRQFEEKIKKLDDTAYLNSNSANAKHLNDSIKELRSDK